MCIPWESRDPGMDGPENIQDWEYRVRGMCLPEEQIDLGMERIWEYTVLGMCSLGKTEIEGNEIICLWEFIIPFGIIRLGEDWALEE